MILTTFFTLYGHLFHVFSENVLPAWVGSTILIINTKHFTWKLSLFRHRSGPNKAHFGRDFQSCRSVVRPFRLLSPPCPPSWNSKILANTCIIATDGFLGRLEPCIRHHFDDIFMYATLCWWHFDVSDMILTAFFSFWHNFFIIFLKMCSPPAQESTIRDGGIKHF